MRYVITGSLGNISRPLAAALLGAGHNVTIITSRQSNAAAIEAIGAKAAVGSVEDAGFLAQVFTGADAVYTMIPPKWDATDWKDWMETIGKNYAEAIGSAGVKYVVNLSSVGAHLNEGAGPVSGLYRVERALNALTGVHIRHLRPGYFYHNQLANISMIQHLGINGGNFGDKPIVMVHPADIAEAAAEELLQLSFLGHTVRYIAGDERSGIEISGVLGTAIGKPLMRWIVFSDEENLQGALEAGLPEELARNYTEMGAAMRTGIMFEDYNKYKPVLSSIKLEDFAKEFAAAFPA